MKTVLIQCRLPEQKAKKLAEIASRENRSKSAQVKSFVELFLDGKVVAKDEANPRTALAA